MTIMPKAIKQLAAIAVEIIRAHRGVSLHNYCASDVYWTWGDLICCLESHAAGILPNEVAEGHLVRELATCGPSSLIERLMRTLAALPPSRPHPFPHVIATSRLNLHHLAPPVMGTDPTMLLRLNDWRLRERLRIEFRYYEAVPAAFPCTPDHCLHVSRVEPGMVAFTESDDKGRRDIQTRMKPGRYLAKFFPDLPPERVHKLQSMVFGHELVFYTSAEDIERAYLEGPPSCMSKSRASFSVPPKHHPTHVYAESDLSLAVLITSTGRIIARGLVWPEKKAYGRLYGDIQRLQSALERKGYGRGSFDGARLRLIKFRRHCADHFLAPYLDSNGHRARIEGKHLIIDEDGDYHLEHVDGSMSVERLSIRCPQCEGRFDDDEGFVLVSDCEEYWCPDCVDNRCIRSGRSGEYRSEGELVIVVVDGGAEDWFSDEVEEHAFYCDAEDRYFASNEFIALELEDGRTVSEAWFRGNGIVIGGKRYEKGKEPDAVDHVRANNISLPVTLLAIDFGGGPTIKNNRFYEKFRRPPMGFDLNAEWHDGTQHATFWGPGGSKAYLPDPVASSKEVAA